MRQKSTIKKNGLERIRKSLKSLDNEIKERYKAEVISVFGSYARGTEKKDSDIDIVVRFKRNATLFDFVGLAEFLETKLHKKIDLVPERAIREELKDRILQEAVAV